MNRRFLILSATLLLLGHAERAWAGMPSVTLSDLSRMRFQTISFFLVVFFLCAGVIRGIWNGLQKDFPNLPRLTYGKALGVMALWGLLFVLVLTMISGARELMTPGAWEKVGWTYALADSVDESSASSLDHQRRLALERLRVLLWSYAEAHDGRFPPDRESPELPESAWRVPDPSGMRFFYRSGLTLDDPETPLVFEPDIFGDSQLVLFTSGAIRPMSEQERANLRGEGGSR